MLKSIHDEYVRYFKERPILNDATTARDSAYVNGVWIMRELQEEFKNFSRRKRYELKRRFYRLSILLKG